MRINYLGVINDIDGVGKILLGLGGKPRHHVCPENQSIDVLPGGVQAVFEELPIIASLHSLQNQRTSTLNRHVKVGTKPVWIRQHCQQIIGKVNGIYGTQSNPESPGQLCDLFQQRS